VAVAGHSMEPTLRDGDWLIYRVVAPRLGDVVVARDPREPERWLVKRVRALSADSIELSGDAPGHDAGRVAPANVIGRVIFRYWPPRRIGPLTGG
jgi:signal peptidase I